MTQQLVIATGNAGKLREIRHIFAGLKLNILPQSEFDAPEAEETGLSFVENAIIKARSAAAHTGLPALADDSGIEVDALNGEPGIHSARYAGDDESNIDRLLRELSGLSEDQRTARFQCIMVYMRHASDPVPLIAHGAWQGRILTERRGEGGFGYDPVFYVPEHGCSAAQLTAEQKNAISHRGKALHDMLHQLAAVY
jgi:XTP/dITP diphosphohydrolase